MRLRASEARMHRETLGISLRSENGFYNVNPLRSSELSKPVFERSLKHVRHRADMRLRASVARMNREAYSISLRSEDGFYNVNPLHLSVDIKNRADTPAARIIYLGAINDRFLKISPATSGWFMV